MDPLNLTGVVTPAPRVPATVGNVVTYVDGVPQGHEDQGDADEAEETEDSPEVARAS